MSKKKICGIYKITNKINGKVYIGQSRDIKNRIRVHKYDFQKNKHHNPHFQKSWNKYGKDNFKFEIIEECEENELNKNEQYWINFYNSFDSNLGYNLTNGGDCEYLFSDVNNEKNRERQSSIPIIQLDFDGNIINIWNHGCREASKKLGLSQSTIWKCCNKESASCYNFIWLYKNDYENNGVNLFWHESNSRYRRIIQLDLYTYEVIRIWESTKEIRCLNFDTGSVTKVCRGKIVSYKGYRWMYYTDYLRGNIDKRYSNSKIVNKILNGEILQTYNSVIEVSKDMECEESCIRRAIYNKSEYKGFYWEYQKLSTENIILN